MQVKDHIDNTAKIIQKYTFSAVMCCGCTIPHLCWYVKMKNVLKQHFFYDLNYKTILPRHDNIISSPFSTKVLNDTGKILDIRQ